MVWTSWVVSFQCAPPTMLRASCSLRIPIMAPVIAGLLSTQASAFGDALQRQIDQGLLVILHDGLQLLTDGSELLVSYCTY